MLQRVRFPPLPGGGSVAPLAGEAGAVPGPWRENGGGGRINLKTGLEMAGDGRRLGPANLDFQRFELGLKEAAAHVAGLCRLWGVQVMTVGH